MNPEKKSDFLKLFALIAALLACALRAAHYAFGTDGRGLLVGNHWSVVGLWIVSAAFGAVVLLLGSSIPRTRQTDVPQFSPALGAAGSFALGVALLLTALRSFGNFTMTADLLIWVLGLCAGLSMIVVGICRLTGKKPYFLLHALLCLYITFRMVSTYRQWSSDPQLQDYGFYLMAHAAAMLAAYHHAAFDAGLGSHRSLWICSLGTLFLSCAALPRSEASLLLASFALWALSNLPALPVRKHRIRPRLPSEEE